MSDKKIQTVAEFLDHLDEETWAKLPVPIEDVVSRTEEELDELYLEYAFLPPERLAYLNAGFPELWEDIERAQRAGRYSH